jgi:HEPN domain-containing protein
MTRPPDHIVAAWMEKADHDLGSAKIIFLHIPDYYDTVAFHCQQAVEKYLKALLVFYNIKFDRQHDLTYLLELLSRKRTIETEQFDKLLYSIIFQLKFDILKKLFILHLKSWLKL